jgi:cell fate (sporulation/competence/biofilm development) regulator YlbF (YheA/YmcA/DUF963 family)
MQTIVEDAVAQKTRELCEALLEQPELRQARQNIEKFMADDRARSQYEALMAKGQALQHKQQNSEALTGEEISAFEKDRDALVSNAVARGYLEAQDQLREAHESINKAVGKTLELGRLPAESDMDGGGCGSGCGCHH